MTTEHPAELAEHSGIAVPAHEGVIVPGPREVWTLANGIARQVFGPLLLNVHPYTECEGHGCPLHSPSEHLMRGWALSYRADRQMFERLCTHGVGHPDPDSVRYHWFISRRHEGTHGCDGCCSVARGSLSRR